MHLWSLRHFFRPYSQQHFARGLRHVNDLLYYDPDATVMDRSDFDGHYAGYVDMDHALRDALDDIYDLGIPDGYTLAELQEKEPELARAVLRAPFSRDPDSGPRNSWCWAHRNSTCRPVDPIYADEQLQLRTYGYVFWDQARLDDWRVLDKPWTQWQKNFLDERRKKQIEREQELEKSYRIEARKYARRTPGPNLCLTEILCME